MRQTRMWRIRQGAVLLIALLFCLAMAQPASSTGRSQLKKAGITCFSPQSGLGCALFIKAKASRVEYRVGKRRAAPAALWGRETWGAKSWRGKPVGRGDCIRVSAVAKNKRGRDRGRVRLCDYGMFPGTSYPQAEYEAAPSYADYRRFRG